MYVRVLVWDFKVVLGGASEQWRIFLGLISFGKMDSSMRLFSGHSWRLFYSLFTTRRVPLFVSSWLELGRGPPLGCRAEIWTRACLTTSRRATIWATPHPPSHAAPCLSHAAPNVKGVLESIPLNRFRQAGNRFLGSLKGFQIRALVSVRFRIAIQQFITVRIHGIHGCNHRVHRVATTAFWRTFSDEGKINHGWWGWGVHAHPLSLRLPSPVKLQCTLQLSGQIHWPCFISTNICTLWL